MAKKKKVVTDAGVEKPFLQAGLLEYSKNAIYTIGNYTLQHRAVPDFRDGLKPVQRRIIYAMQQNKLFSTTGHKKAARIVGDVVGKYHPHGDAAVFDAVVNMVTRFKINLVDGSGNWGTLLDDASAMRYVECRLSKNADQYFSDPDYCKVQDFIPNYDGNEVEPVILHSKVPNVLLQGTYGIGFGSVCSIPAFELKGVLQLTKKALQGTKITSKMCMKYLVPTCTEGGEAYLDEKDCVDELERFYKTGKGSIYWVPKYELDVDKRNVLIYGFSPQTAISLAKCLEKVSQDPSVDRIRDTESSVEHGLRYRIYLKKSIAKSDVEDTLLELTSYFEASINYNFLLTERVFNKEKGDCDVIVHSKWSLPEFFENWADWRIKVEKKVLRLRMDRINQQIERQELLELIVIHRDVIIKALDVDDSEALLMKKLKINKEQAAFIMDSKIRSLKSLELKAVRNKLKDLRTEFKAIKKTYKNPVDAICDDLSKLEV